MHAILAFITYVFTSIIIYFFIFLLYSNFHRVLKRKLKNFLKAKLYSKLLKYKNGNKINPHKYFWLKTNLGLEAVLEVLNELDDKNAKYLKIILKNANYRDFMVKLLKTQDMELLAFNVRLIGELDIKTLESKVIRILYKNKDNVYVQYNCLLTLAKFGSKKIMLEVFNRKNLDIYLTDSALREVFCAYKGEQVGLYKTLLKTSNPTVLRLCIKMIGIKKYQSLSKDIIPCLDSTNYEIIITTIKSLGELKETTALPKLKKLYEQNHTGIKAEIINALANIDLNKGTTTIKNGLFDNDWWVRYSAAMVLVNHPKFNNIYKETALLNDQLAIEILDYAKERKKIMERGEKHERSNLHNSYIR